MNHFFDVGAHNGNTFQHLGGEYDGWNIWCFEPSPRHLPDLILRARHLKHRFNVTICPFGLGGKTEVLEFYLKNDPQADSFSNKFSENQDAGCKFVVPIQDISDFILKYTNKDDTIHLKLDCETSEYGILNSLINNVEAFSRVKKLMVEFHSKENNNSAEFEKDCNEFITKCQELGHVILLWGN